MSRVHDGDLKEDSGLMLLSRRPFLTLPNEPVSASFPAGQRLGADDICWLKAVMRATFAGLPYKERFAIRNPSGRSIEVAIRDPAREPTSTASGNQGELSLATNVSGDELLFLTIARSDENQTGHAVT